MTPVPARLRARHGVRSRLALVTPPLVAVVILLSSGHEANAILCGLALAAVIAAAREHRPRAMMIAIGLATGLSPAGAIIIPLAIGLAVRRRAARWLPLAPLVAAATWWLTGSWPASASLPSLTDLALARPVLSALIAASGIGFGSWIAADASSRFLSPRAMLASGLSLAVFVPTPLAVLLLPLAFAGEAVRADIVPRRAANDNPVTAGDTRVAV